LSLKLSSTVLVPQSVTLGDPQAPSALVNKGTLTHAKSLSDLFYTGLQIGTSRKIC